MVFAAINPIQHPAPISVLLLPKAAIDIRPALAWIKLE